VITETSGFSYLGSDCGYKWIPSTSRGLPAGSSLGIPVAVIIDGTVVATFSTYPPIWEAMSSATIVDTTSEELLAEGKAVIELRSGESVVFTVAISDQTLAAALTSNPTLIELTNDTALVVPGWRYVDGSFQEPV
jgi:hypothetical protein